MESEAWSHIPPWIIVAVIPVEWIVVGDVIPRGVGEESEVRIIESADSMAERICIHDVESIVDVSDFRRIRI